MVKKDHPKNPFEGLITWVGSTQSLMLHTFLFAASFLVVILGVVALDTMLLVVTTIVSLEAIYLAIFIQMSVNQNTLSLREVEEDIDEIEEELEDLTEDDREEEEREKQQSAHLEDLSKKMQDILATLETLKK